ncbi:MAG: aminotransferase class I/II-fold pyridoxal phosphate-dependent enzyme [Maricaulaceae bacterium]|jgi:aspartate/methionine/tyrosine aminotransferase
MNFKRMVMEKESPEELGYDKIKCNLSESSIADRRLSELGLDLGDLLLFYGDHSGVPELREILGSEHYGLGGESVLLCAGACMALFVVNATLLSPGDHLLVVHPNYATNVEVPRSLGVDVDLLRLNFDDQFRLNLDALERRIRPETKLVSVTYPHNPSGVVISPEELRALISIAERHGCWLLVDETYRELTFGEKLPPAATLSDRAISVESVSKSFGVPGIRMGWIASQNGALMERFLATKEQISICNSVVDEHIALEVFRRRRALLAETTQKNAANFDCVRTWVAGQKLLEWVEPSGGVVCFPRFRKDVELDIDAFYRVLFEKHGTFVAPGRWFEEDQRYFRIGYGWPSGEELAAGLNAIDEAAAEAAL